MQSYRLLPLALCICAPLFASGCLIDDDHPDRTEYSVNQHDDVSIFDVTWGCDTTSYYPKLTVQGKFKNTGTVEITNVYISVKAYASGSLLYTANKRIASSIDSLTQTSWEISHTDYDHDVAPDSVSFGYSYDVKIDIPAKKQTVVFSSIEYEDSPVLTDKCRVLP